MTFLLQHQKESGIPAGGAQGGWRRRGGEAFIFVKIVGYLTAGVSSLKILTQCENQT